VLDRELERAVVEMRRPGDVIFWDVDAPATLDSWAPTRRSAAQPRAAL
jgi:hypothetical protein